MVPEVFASATEFLAALRPSSERWGASGEPLESPWHFRGQGDAAWGLVPGFFRFAAHSRFILLWHASEEMLEKRVREYSSQPPEVRNLFSWRFVEDQLLRDFVRHCAATALVLPSGPPDFKGTLRKGTSGTLGFDGVPNIVSAIAQHHGVATRLVDFTRDARVAALFAALDCLQQRLAPEQIAVWAVQRKESYPRRVEWIDVPRHLDEYVHAQSGVLAYDVDADEHFLRGAWPMLEDAMQADSGEGSVRKLCLPNSEVSPLLDLLAREQLTWAHVRPGYDGCGEAVMLRHGAFGKLRPVSTKA